MRVTAEQVPSLHRVAPTYLKLVAFSYFWSFTLILVHALRLFVVLVVILLLSVLTSILYVFVLSASLLVRCLEVRH